MKPVFLRLHRWISLTFALPLLAVILTGLVLSFEPIAQVSAVKPGSLTLPAVEALLAKADPEGKAGGLSIAPQDGTLTIGGGPGGPGRSFDLSTGAPRAGGTWAGVFNTARGLHERLIGDLGWLVTASTIAMLVIVTLGVLMGLPRLRNTVPGWHKGTAWFLLPLVVLSPLTGLALAFGITLSAPLAPAGGGPVPLVQALRMVAADHDLSTLNSIRRRGPVMMARVWEGGELAAYAVTSSGLVRLPRNWPRLIHEGNGAGVWSGGLNVITSVALTGLLGTGVWIWARRSLRRRPGALQAARAAGNP
ncbi:PepSY-associated TM helix domain-containing protein [Prosthecomicrobium sp. N25]|uniref:PepSY-associated TM helix domain-containing protein n=1 Tax=Prosthecomicrobium sp. N25 TaxID=3129254 RepID=UPI0030787338